jgi:asparagine synthase (glutamine-hydrolysing)
MCGIFGYIGSIDEQLATHCTNTLAHRGPDGFGLWVGRGVTLGHRRLSILDLSANASQPMHSYDGRYTISFNGEIYNYLEIKKELISLGHIFRSESDTEVILNAYMEWGVDCQPRFNGMWAFAIWDSIKGSLFLSRDRFGKKPLYYAELRQGEFAFASEMKALMPLLPHLNANIALLRNTDRWMLYEGTEECVIEGIKRFPAAHFGVFESDRFKLSRWWSTLDNLMQVSNKYVDQVDQFREIFLDSCRIRMRSDVPIGTALSGGLDSSGVISSISHLATTTSIFQDKETWKNVFVASFPGTKADEVTYAKMVADHLQIKPNIVSIDPLKSISRLYEYLYMMEDPYISPPIPFIQTYSAVKAAGVSVTLDGHGADELFGGYGFDFIHTLNQSDLTSDQRNEVVETYLSSNGLQNSKTAIYSLLFKWYGKNAIKRFMRMSEKKISSEISTHKNWNTLDRLNQRLYLSTHENVLPTLLRNYDRYGMSCGVEIRMPFMDYRLVSFAFSIPWTSKIKGKFTKRIVRDALCKFMPREIAYRKDKIGFNAPTGDWMSGKLREFFLDAISSQDFKECNLINSVAVASLVRKSVNNPNLSFAGGTEVWTKISPYLWEKAMLLNNSPSHRG